MDDHMWVWSMEDTTPDPWELWVTQVEKDLGFTLDGDQYFDGYSLDWAYDLFKEGLTPGHAADKIRAGDGYALG